MTVALRAIFMSGLLLAGSSLDARPVPPSLQDSFPIGNGAAGLCQAQSSANDPAITSMFDRAWNILCRDSAQPVGQIYALRGVADTDALIARIAAVRPGTVECSGDGGMSLPGVGPAIQRNCTLAGGTLPYRLIVAKRGRTSYVAQGFGAYTSALDIALRTVALDRPIDEKVEIAVLGSADGAAFARLQAATLDPQVALGEGYRRNAAGDYAQAAEFFDTLNDRLANESDAKLTPAERAARAHEYLINRALQLSNLSAFDQADALFVQASQIATGDPVQTRLRRNFLAMHQINQGDYSKALAILDQPTADPAIQSPGDGGLLVSERTAGEMNGSIPVAKALGMVQVARLTPEERAAIIDAQAQQLRGTIWRLRGNPAGARALLERALGDAVAIREGRVVSITRLRAQLLGEIGLTYEAQGDYAAAEGSMRTGLALLAMQYPETIAMNGARARIAAFLVRRDRRDEALGLYRTIIQSTVENRSSLTGLSNQLQPYFALLAAEIPARPALVEDLFAASQTLLRPGAADSLELLSRSLAAGPGEASSLFRQSVSLNRDVERTRIAIAQMTEAKADAAAIATQQQALADLTAAQARTVAALGAFPQYRAVGKDILTLAELRTALRPGEAYMKLAQLGDAIYAIWVDGAGATGYRLPVTAGQMAGKVAALRETISTSVNGTQTTYAFDVPTARALFVDLFAPVEGRLASADHLIFEPDGAMLQLPVNLLVTKQAGVDAYAARNAKAGADEFDFRGIDWLGRSHAVSTALSARAFRDSRAASSSAAKRAYLGAGENARTLMMQPAALRPGPAAGPDCNWPMAQWNRPIAATELRSVAALLRNGSPELVTGGAFTDTALLARTDLDNFRILHFATHGLIAAPRPQCPARPALLTSFGPTGQSNGLLEFGEIFNLKLDADLVVLSACDTAAGAGTQASRVAGLSGGGGALDGLVRAFIGAGGRSIIASHWPAPDEFKATERLITAIFTAPPGEGTAKALQSAEIMLMDQAETSHPFYWGGFALIGDGARPLTAAAQ